MSARPTARTVTGGSIYVAVTVVVTAVAAWPIYASAAYLLLVAVSVAVAAGIAVLAALRRWGGWTVAAVLGGAFALLVVPLAVPSRLGGAGELVRGLGDGASGVLLAWKDLVTVDLPVGSYRNLLVPALVVFLVGTVAALLLAWRSDRRSAAAVAVGLAMASFGLFFGRAAVSTPLRLGPFTLYAPVETAVGATALTAALLWLAWRARDERWRALRRAAGASGVRMPLRPTRTDRRRTALGAGMVSVALVAAVAVVPWAARGADREVLRSAAGPERDIAAAVSPLSDYRALFAADREDDVLFRVSGGRMPERVRLATLDSYDGEVYRTGGGDAGAADPFVRVPAALEAGEGAEIDARFEIVGLDGIWMPTAGRLRSVDFGGPRSAALADGFYYSAAAEAGVQVAGGGLATGDSYRLQAVDKPGPDLSNVSAPGTQPGGVQAPENLRRWVKEHATGTGGASLGELVRLLRERGFLSHALSIGQPPPSWASELGEYRFQPSASGHSLARVDALFSRLLERESDPRAAAADNYVAAVGDDEQFAVATALIARELGFPARVVVGARLAVAEEGLAACQDGVCRAQDVSAWTEVRSSDGRWLPVDVTPQWTRSPSLDVTEQRDPENVTEVRPDSVAEVVPPAPVQKDSARDDAEERPAGPDFAWLWPVLRIGGLVLLVLAILVGPFLVIVAAKAARRRGRRSADEPVSRIAGGWEEYVDAGVDAGREASRVLTRSELAAAYGTESGPTLAETADRAIFSLETTTMDDAEEFWRIVDLERRSLRQGLGIWRSILAAVSLRSFARFLVPRTPVRGPSFVERGRRRTRDGARTTS